MALQPDIALAGQPNFPTAQSVLSLQAVQRRMQDEQMMRQRAAQIAQYYQTHPDARDPITGINTPKAIVDLASLGFTDVADAAAQHRALVLKETAEEGLAKAKKEAIFYKQQGDMTTDALIEAKSAYMTTPGSPEQKDRAKREAWQNFWKDARSSGRANSVRFSDQVLDQMMAGDPGSADAIDFKVGALKERLQRIEAYEAKPPGQPSTTQQGVPLSKVGEAETPPDGGLRIELDQPPEVRELPESEKDPTEGGTQGPVKGVLPQVDIKDVMPPEQPATLRDRAQVAEKEADRQRTFGTPTANKAAQMWDKKANDLRTQADKLERSLQGEEKILNAKQIAEQREIRLSAAQKLKDADITPYSPEGIATLAWSKLLFGKDPPGLGKASANQRAQVVNKAAELGGKLGLSAQEQAMLPQDNKVKMKAVDKMTTWGAFVAKSSDQLNQSLDLAIAYAKKIGPEKLRIINKAILAGKKEFNDPLVTAYALQVNTVRTEYGRLMTGPTSNAMLPVEALKKADEMVSNAQDVPSWMESAKAIRNDAKITANSVQNTIDSLHGSMLGGAPTETGKKAVLEPIGPQGELTDTERKELEDLRRKHRRGYQ
jgi:hypothetical protein